MAIISLYIMLQVFIICILDAHKMDILANCGCPDENGMGFPTMWYMRQAKFQISLRIRAV